VKQDADGDLIYVERSADIIKHKAFRVSASEVEAVLQDHPTVIGPAWWVCRTQRSVSGSRRLWSSRKTPGEWAVRIFSTGAETDWLPTRCRATSNSGYAAQVKGGKAPAQRDPRRRTQKTDQRKN